MGFRSGAILSVSTLLVPVMALLVSVPLNACAQDHVVSPAELKAEVRSAAQSRQANIDALQRLLATDAAAKVMQTAGIDPARVRRAVPLLDDQELARLAAQANQADFTGSSLTLTNQQLTYIILGVLIIVLVAVLVSH